VTETVTAKRERKYQRAKLRKVDMQRFNAWDSDQRMAITADCAYAAVAELFSWLPADQIRKPPASLFDAKLARQMATHIMAEALDMPRRQIGRLQGRQRTHIHLSLHAIERRLEETHFAIAYQGVADRALSMLKERFGEDAVRGCY
jgi:hypothetical protein